MADKTNDKSSNLGDGKFHFSIDRGGTFTDIHCILPNGLEIVEKLLSVDPMNYNDAPTEGIRRILSKHATNDDTGEYKRDMLVKTKNIGSIRMGTTVATNALLERNGERMALIITKGFGDLLEIGNQSRPDIFDLSINKPSLLYEDILEIDERLILMKYVENDNNKNNKLGVKDVLDSVTGEKLGSLIKPQEDIIKKDLQKVYNKGIRSIAIVFMHSFVNNKHERIVGSIAKEIGFTQISLSSEVMPMVKIVSRGHTACAAAYLTPCIVTYLQSFRKGFDKGLDNINLTFMKSDGGLTNANDFYGHQAILSGPAAGVIGYAKTCYDNSHTNINGDAVIGFDMGGTSTDVSRYAGVLEHVFETTTAGIAIQAPQLDINTVAAGGGSRLFIKHGMFVVGPQSAGAHPGPICYRKNGYLAVTDANLVCGRIIPKYFPYIFGKNENQCLDYNASYNAFQQLIIDNPTETNNDTVEDIAYGFLQVANEAMCRPIRNLTQMKGFDITTHTLACFGGAGPQHACAMAKNLGMKRVFIHRYGGVLSAYGLALADAVNEEQEPAADIYSTTKASPSDHNNVNVVISKEILQERFNTLIQKAKQSLIKQGYNEENIHIEKFLNMRYDGTDNAIMIQKSSNNNDNIDYADSFTSHYQREFGFILSNRNILIDDYRIRAIVPGRTIGKKEEEEQSSSLVAVKDSPPPPIKDTTRAFFEDGWHENTPVYDMEELKPGHTIHGPAIIIQSISTIILEIDCDAIITSDGDMDISIKSTTTNMTTSCVTSPTATTKNKQEQEAQVVEDPIQLSIFSHRFMGVAEQMGRTLARTAISVNIKERLDFSCAIFSPTGGLVANAPHIPVHLGAMQSAVQFQMKYWESDGREGIQEGDVLVSNHPQLAGGSHLPDITVITPVFLNNEIIFFVASRGHHADIGGIAPGSMPPHSQSLEEEGAMIVAFKLVRNNQFQEQSITDILMSPAKLGPNNSGTRNIQDNLSDLKAQVAANNSGIRLLKQLVNEYDLDTVHSYMEYIQKNAEVAVRSMLKEFAMKHGPKTQAVDYMDDGSPIKLAIAIDMETGDAAFDFTGTGPQVLANHNAPPAVTYSAVIYSLRSLVNEDIPLNQGCLTPITFIIPKYTLLNPSDTAGVVGGNVLTSQRIVDVVLKAFHACAASQGCMNNLTFGDDQFGYYETIAGGAGAGNGWNGRSGVHTHCTNTRITDPEILERRYPVLLRAFALRKGSGGSGKYAGGDGVIREIEPLRPLVMSILSERRCLRPYGMNGGGDAQSGLNLVVRDGGHVVNIGGRCTATLNVGERLRIETPGGGGYGVPGDKVTESKDIEDKSFVAHACGSLDIYAESQMTA